MALEAVSILKLVHGSDGVGDAENDLKLGVGI